MAAALDEMLAWCLAVGKRLVSGTLWRRQGADGFIYYRDALKRLAIDGVH